MRLLTLIALSLAPLSGCVTASSNCPALVNYTQAEQSKAADELEALPSGSVLARMIGDYGATRNEIRACRGQ